VTPLLYLLIPGKRPTFYQVVPLDPHPDVAVRAWSVRSATGKSYDVAICANGWTSCTCADSTYRSLGNCKHVRALRALGLLTKGGRAS
jgi:hypothetical protein